jgi:LAO/AO transport system kinase
MIPNAGDELQGIKKGIMELVDALVINKADGESVNLAKQSQRHYQNAFHLLHTEDYWQPRVLTCSALENNNLDQVWDMVQEYHASAVEHDQFQHKRQRQNIDWMQKLIYEMVDQRLTQNPDIRRQLPALKTAVTDGELTPFKAARQVVDLL